MQHHPEIALTSKAREYLHRRQTAELSLELKPLHNCCIPYSPPPHISAGHSRQLRDCVTLQQDDVTLYLDPALCEVRRLTIDLCGFGVFSWLSVVDWQPLPP